MQSVYVVDFDSALLARPLADEGWYHALCRRAPAGADDLGARPATHPAAMDRLRRAATDGDTVVLLAGEHPQAAQRVAQDEGWAMLPGDEAELDENLAKWRATAAMDHKPVTIVAMADGQRCPRLWAAADRRVAVVKRGADIASSDATPHLLPADDTLHLSAGLIKPILKLIRPHQWAKNLLVFLPLFLAHAWGDSQKVLAAAVVFVAFSLLASAVYVINDLVDVEADRRHRSKHRRPLASGAVPLGMAIPLAAGLTIVSVAMAVIALPRIGLAMLLLYMVVTSAYSFWLKRKMMLDVLVLAGLYTLRIVAGAAACSVVISEWLMAFSMFFFLSLAFVKRYTELAQVQQKDGSQALRGRGYRPSDLSLVETLGACSGYLSIAVLALYLRSDKVVELYPTPSLLWLICPLMIYWISRIWFLAKRQELSDDPVSFAVRDMVSLLIAVLVGVIVFLAAKMPREMLPLL